ncbi:hypothetical protein ACFOD9_04300 [Novosphingobium bradum]|uniref:Helicase/UvrB N-terminal domain-containing protein n=1 Tax=Novosphingobium bradum TaxID=1737444 RepID=A0ABV7IN95_9SPHN
MLNDYFYSDFGFDYEFYTCSTYSSSIFPELKTENPFSVLKRVMKESLTGTCKPCFYILPAACGSGKSTSVQAFIRDWKDRGFEEGGSAIIMLPTLEEIDTYVSGCGLEKADYACLSPDRNYAKLGLGRGKADQARVLFVTHEQARRRMLEQGSFGAGTLPLPAMGGTVGQCSVFTRCCR